MKTTTVETSQLSGPALDWAVAKSVAKENVKIEQCRGADAPAFCVVLTNGAHWTPSTDWTQGGPLIERYCGITNCEDEKQPEPFYAETRCSNLNGYANGTTILIAVCRAIVAAELGDDVEVPVELLVEVGE